MNINNIFEEFKGTHANMIIEKSENNLLLKDKIFELLTCINKSGKYPKDLKMIKIITNNQLEEFRKISGSYWQGLYSVSHYSETEKLKNDFVNQFILKINKSNLTDTLEKIDEYLE